MAWAFAFEAPAGECILSSRFIGVTTYCDLWWSDTEKKWVDYKEVKDDEIYSSTMTSCRSFKAFKRHLRKHPELKAADEVIFVSQFVGYDIRAKWVE